jgi:EAL domain-containing protein (putative c-di-GMP-specific phosphodiesterase class I)
VTGTKPEEGRPVDRFVRRGRALLGVPDPHDTDAPAWASAGLLAVLLAGAWSLSYALGGAGVVPPHWFYLPIGAAASRFRYGGAVVVAAASGLLAGPLLPLSVEGGTTQPVSEWVGRTISFTVIGVFVGWLVDLYRSATFELRSSKAVAMALMGEVGRAPAPRPVGRRRIEAALLAETMEVALQPIVRIDDGDPIGFEALARFPVPPDRSPRAWFSEAWSVGLGVDLEMAALRAAVRLLPDLSDGFLSVNISPATIVSPEFRASLDGLPRDRLVVEMTEHVPVSDYRTLRACLKELRERGVRYAVDDAGAGYASLQHVIRLEPDIIKVDMGLVRGVDRDPLLRSMTRALIRFGEETGALIVAEGVEREAELQVLRALGARFAQGFLFARPQAPRAIRLTDLTASSPSRPGGGGATPRTGTRG